MTTPSYTLATVEDDHGRPQLVEALWTPTGEDAVRRGFINHHGLYLTGVGPESEPPTEFVALGHGHTWTAICQAATAYMQFTYGVPDLYTDPDTRQPIPDDVRTPLPVEQHAVFILAAAEAGAWEGTWRLVYVEAGESGAVAVTTMQRPAVTR